jgi:hypothetical protein
VLKCLRNQEREEPDRADFPVRGHCLAPTGELDRDGDADTSKRRVRMRHHCRSCGRLTLRVAVSPLRTSTSVAYGW